MSAACTYAAARLTLDFFVNTSLWISSIWASRAAAGGPMRAVIWARGSRPGPFRKGTGCALPVVRQRCDQAFRKQSEFVL